MRVCKHGYDVKMFCFSRANHATTQGFELKNSIFLVGGKSLEKCRVNFFSLELRFSERKTDIFESIFFAKQGLSTRAYKLRVQDFATCKNLSFNQCFKQESFAFFLGKVIL